MAGVILIRFVRHRLVLSRTGQKLDTNWTPKITSILSGHHFRPRNTHSGAVNPPPRALNDQKVLRNADRPSQCCGHTAVQYITELGETRRREFSVGFVSVAAGIFLAVGLVQHAWSCGDLIHGDVNQFTFSFLDRMPGRNFFPRDPDCECARAGGALFRRIWAGG